LFFLSHRTPEKGLIEVKKMKKMLLSLTILLVLGMFTACNRGEGGQAGYGAGGGESLRKGSTSPLHSPIAQDETYQKLLGLNIILYPPPVDDPKFDAYGKAHWDIDAKDFTAAVTKAFTGTMGEEAVYEPKVDALQNLPLVDQIKQTIYEGKAVRVGWVYGNNANLDYMEFNGARVTLIPVYNTVVFVAAKTDLDQSTFKLSVGKTSLFYLPAGSVVELLPDTLHSAPIRVANATGQLTVVIVPEGVGVGSASKGSGIDQALFAPGRWLFGFPDNKAGFFAGLDGTNTNINAVDAK
jgi:hypothetical protein